MAATAEAPAARRWISLTGICLAVFALLFALRFRPYGGALVANLTMNLSFAGLSYLLVLWLKNVRGYDPVTAGLLMLPSTLGIFVFIPLGGRLSAKVDDKLPVMITGVIGLVAAVLVFFIWPRRART